MKSTDVYEFCSAFKQQQNCDACGSKRQLTWHHKDPFAKVGEITSVMKVRGFDAGLEEINKCVLLCRRCHRLLHGLYSGPFPDGLKTYASEFFEILFQAYMESLDKLQRTDLQPEEYMYYDQRRGYSGSELLRMIPNVKTSLPALQCEQLEAFILKDSKFSGYKKLVT